MNDIRIIFFDIDGTLIDPAVKRISEKTVEALQRLRQNGIRICIATGRAPMTLPVFEDIEFDAFLTFNGSYCYAGDQVIHRNPIPQPDVRRLIENAAKIGRPVSIATKDRLTANGRDEDLAEYYAIVKLGVDVTDDFGDVSRDDVYQVMLGLTPQEYPALMQGVTGAKITAWWDRAVDVIPADGGKGVAVEKMLQYFHLDRSQAAAFGDGNNDIDMLRAVGLGVAMGNASSEVKAAAKDVCGHVAGDGIYHYCLNQGWI